MINSPKNFTVFLLMACFQLVTSKLISAENDIINTSTTYEILNIVKHYLPKNPVIIEAGAYDGKDTLTLAHYWPYGRVYSFEPVPELHNYSLNTIGRTKNAKLYNKALSDTTGHSIIYLSSSNNNITASSSLLPPDKHLEYAPHIKFDRTIEVDTITLDDWAKTEQISRIDFLWLDLQGYELNVLQASRLAKEAFAIYTEVEFIEAYRGQYLFSDMLNWMELHGFKLIATDLDLKNPAWFGNALFVKSK